MHHSNVLSTGYIFASRPSSSCWLLTLLLMGLMIIKSHLQVYSDKSCTCPLSGLCLATMTSQTFPVASPVPGKGVAKWTFPFPTHEGNSLISRVFAGGRIVLADLVVMFYFPGHRLMHQEAEQKTREKKHLKA